MIKEEVIANLESLGMDDMLELIEDAQSGHLEELELVESIGLLYDQDLNKALLNVLKDLGVTIVFVADEEDKS